MVKTFTDKLLDNLPQHMTKDEDSNNYNFFKSLKSSLDNITININGTENSIQLNTATGAYLDAIGKLFSLNRTTNESDTNFRARIKAYFQANIGGGSKPNMKDALANSFGVPEENITVVISTVSSSIFHLEVLVTDTVPLEIFNNVLQIVDKTKAAGVYFDTSQGNGGVIIGGEQTIFMTQISKTNSEDKLL